MDERNKELADLNGYGLKLAEMLQETLRHLHDIAIEYSKEADTWRGKYNECSAQNQDLRQQLTALKSVIAEQSETIENLERDFNRKLTDLRNYRDAEIQNYNDKVQSLIEAQKSLTAMKAEAESARDKASNAIEKHEEARNKYERLIEVNQTKLDRYDELDEFQRTAQSKIASLEKQLDDKDDEAAAAITALKAQFDKEREHFRKVERELAELKNSPSNEDTRTVPEMIEEIRSNHSEEDEDDTK